METTDGSDETELIALTLEVELRQGVYSSADIAALHQRLGLFFKERPFSSTNHEVTSTDLTPDLATNIQSIHITYPGGPDADAPPIRFWWEVKPKIFTFQYHREGPIEEVEDEETGSFAREWNLPSETFRFMWEHLHFDQDLKTRLLGYVEMALLFSQSGVDRHIINWNRLVLLYGPPGDSQTARMNSRVRTPSQNSKWYSESSKLIGRLFEKIQRTLVSNDVLLFILIDEVESLTSARKAAVGSSEPSDAIRSVNVLLTQLDRLQTSPNVVLMTTSNITEAIDDAFLDRADIKIYVGPPSSDVRYQILHSCIRELLRVGLVEECLPSLSGGDTEVMELLRRCVELTEGVSCRFLKKLPFIASIQCLAEKTVSVKTLLQEMHRLMVSQRSAEMCET